MRPFSAVTESGTHYNFDGSFVHINARDRVTGEGRRGYVIRPWVIKNINPEVMETWERIDWDYIRDLETSEPEVGKRLYVAGRDDWRLSTIIVSVTFGEAFGE